MTDLLKLLSSEQTETATTYTLLSILISVIAAAGLVCLIFVLLPRMSRSITVVKKHRSDGSRFVVCKYRGKENIHSLRCDSELIYDKLKPGKEYIVKIKDNGIVKLCKSGDEPWKHKGKR